MAWRRFFFCTAIKTSYRPKFWGGGVVWEPELLFYLALVIGIFNLCWIWLCFSVKASNCYGCASSAVEHCITLLRALVTNTNLRQILCGQVSFIKKLISLKWWQIYITYRYMCIMGRKHLIKSYICHNKVAILVKLVFNTNQS
jgi:hypothetical protein